MISPAIYGNCTRLVNQARPRPIAAADSRGRSAASFAPRGCSPASYFPRLAWTPSCFPGCGLEARTALPAPAWVKLALRRIQLDVPISSTCQSGSCLFATGWPSRGNHVAYRTWPPGSRAWAVNAQLSCPPADRHRAPSTASSSADREVTCLDDEDFGGEIGAAASRGADAVFGPGSAKHWIKRAAQRDGGQASHGGSGVRWRAGSRDRHSDGSAIPVSRSVFADPWRRAGDAARRTRRGLARQRQHRPG